MGPSTGRCSSSHAITRNGRLAAIKSFMRWNERINGRTDDYGPGGINLAGNSGVMASPVGRCSGFQLAMVSYRPTVRGLKGANAVGEKVLAAHGRGSGIEGDGIAMLRFAGGTHPMSRGDVLNLMPLDPAVKGQDVV